MAGVPRSGSACRFQSASASAGLSPAVRPRDAGGGAPTLPEGHGPQPTGSSSPPPHTHTLAGRRDGPARPRTRAGSLDPAPAPASGGAWRPRGLGAQLPEPAAALPCPMALSPRGDARWRSMPAGRAQSRSVAVGSASAALSDPPLPRLPRSIELSENLGFRLARHLQKKAQAQHNNSEFTEEQKKTIGKIATCLELRGAALQSTQSQEEFKLEDLKKLEPILKNILTYNKEFPFDVQPSPLRRILAPGEEEHLEFEEDEEEGGAGAGSPNSFPARVPGTLLPRLPSEPGMTLLTIRIEKIGLKDAGQCIDPYITVSVKDLNGIDLTPVQDTPVASRKEDTYVHFNVDIELQKYIEKLTKGAAIFFEFKHYKLTKRFTSTKCFAFMEMDEIKPGPTVIEL
ncbi:axin interactor, dorsalization-associated protein-like [Ictidomys tridecemlineatus]